MPSKDRIGTSRYVPRQKSKSRIANTQIGLSLATTIMNLSRNDDTNMSRMLVNDINTEVDAITKPDDHSHVNLTTQQMENDPSQSTFPLDVRRKSQPNTKRT